MKNLVEMAVNKALNDIVDTTIREAVKLQKEANDLRARVAKVEAKKISQVYDKISALGMGVHALCHVLWRLFGGCPADSIDAIRRIVAENDCTYLGGDSRDYVQLFLDAFER